MGARSSRRRERRDDLEERAEESETLDGDWREEADDEGLPRRCGAWRFSAALACHVALLGWLAWPWILAAQDSLPASRGAPFVYADDARFIVFVLGWVSRALGAEPLSLYDAPIHHPAPFQLAGSEHFLSSQLVAAPVHLATGNAVLATNAAALLSYPLAAAFAFLWTFALGASPAAAWLGGVLFALGPLRAPANVQILQYLNFYLPLLAWSLLWLRARPTRGRAVALFAVALMGGLSSYHAAAMLGLVGVVCVALELARRGPGRLRFVALALAAGGAALAVIAVLSIPYFLRPEARDAELLGVMGIRGASPLMDAVRWFFLLAEPFFGVVPLLFALLGLAAMVLPHAGVARRIGVIGLVFLLIGGALMLPSESIRAVIDSSPLRFVRAPWRFVTIAGLGTALLAVAGLHALFARMHRPVARVSMLAIAAAAILLHGQRLLANGLEPIGALAFDRGLYEAVGRAAAVRGAGPLLELPTFDAAGDGVRSDVPRALLDTDAMVGATLHQQPLIAGRTGYPPPHKRMIDEMIEDLPAPAALAQLVDATRLRWLLLRPEGYWADIRARRALLANPAVETVLEREGWVLARVQLEPRRADWYAAIASPDPRRRSPLGTPLEPLESRAAAAEVLAELLPSEVKAKGFRSLRVVVRNRGTVTWPVTSYVGTRFGVFIAARWLPVPGSTGEEAVQAFALPRDVGPGESVSLVLTLKTPPVPGTYDLDLRIKQWGGSRFEGAGDQALRARIHVAPRGSSQGGALEGEGAAEG